MAWSSPLFLPLRWSGVGSCPSPIDEWISTDCSHHPWLLLFVVRFFLPGEKKSMNDVNSSMLSLSPIMHRFLLSIPPAWCASVLLATSWEAYASWSRQGTIYSLIAFICFLFPLLPLSACALLLLWVRWWIFVLSLRPSFSFFWSPFLFSSAPFFLVSLPPCPTSTRLRLLSASPFLFLPNYFCVAPLFLLSLSTFSVCMMLLLRVLWWASAWADWAALHSTSKQESSIEKVCSNISIEIRISREFVWEEHDDADDDDDDNDSWWMSGSFPPASPAVLSFSLFSWLASCLVFLSAGERGGMKTSGRWWSAESELSYSFLPSFYAFIPLISFSLFFCSLIWLPLFPLTWLSLSALYLSALSLFSLPVCQASVVDAGVWVRRCARVDIVYTVSSASSPSFSLIFCILLFLLSLSFLFLSCVLLFLLSLVSCFQVSAVDWRRVAVSVRRCARAPTSPTPSPMSFSPRFFPDSSFFSRFFLHMHVPGQWSDEMRLAFSSSWSLFSCSLLSPPLCPDCVTPSSIYLWLWLFCLWISVCRATPHLLFVSLFWLSLCTLCMVVSFDCLSMGRTLLAPFCPSTSRPFSSYLSESIFWYLLILFVSVCLCRGCGSEGRAECGHRHGLLAALSRSGSPAQEGSRHDRSLPTHALSATPILTTAFTLIRISLHCWSGFVSCQWFVCVVSSLSMFWLFISRPWFNLDALSLLLFFSFSFSCCWCLFCRWNYVDRQGSSSGRHQREGHRGEAGWCHAYRPANRQQKRFWRGARSCSRRTSSSFCRLLSSSLCCCIWYAFAFLFAALPTSSSSSSSLFDSQEATTAWSHRDASHTRTRRRSRLCLTDLSVNEPFLSIHLRWLTLLDSCSETSKNKELR